MEELVLGTLSNLITQILATLAISNESGTVTINDKLVIEITNKGIITGLFQPGSGIPFGVPTRVRNTIKTTTI
uniref:Sporulation protein YtfJ n=1 Tax=Syphacia muris TaxID=451379 RepID=A0A0N5AKC1_9BILA